MSLEMTIPKAEIRQIAEVILPGNSDNTEFRAHVFDYMRSERDRMRVVRQSGRMDSDAPIDDELRQLRSLRRRAEKAVDGTLDFYQGGAEVARGRVSMLASRLGSSAPWWLPLLRIQPVAQHPLISPIRSREEQLRDRRGQLRKAADNSDVALKASRNRTGQAAEDFLSFCDGIAAPQPEAVVREYVRVRPDRIQHVAELFAQNHGLEEEYLRFLPKCIRSYRDGSIKEGDAGRAKDTFGALWNQMRAQDSSQLSVEAKILWFKYLAQNLLAHEWSSVILEQH